MDEIKRIFLFFLNGKIIAYFKKVDSAFTSTLKKTRTQR